jgi:hypothetical protein
MDDLKYYYYKKDGNGTKSIYDPLVPLTGTEYRTNQLAYVTDNQTITGNYPEDIETQTNPSNYSYDAIGNLIEDKQASITIKWTLNGKIEQIKWATGKRIEYKYDPMGIRISKTVILPNIPTVTTTYYIHDASGNFRKTSEV